MVLAALTDKLDGVLARKLHQTSDWGKILDPLADKIAIATVVLVLLVLNLLPMWFVWLSLGRDAAILAGGIYLRTRRGLLLPSNELGKWTVGIVSLYLFLLIVHGPQWAVDIFVSCSVVLLVVSFALYAHRFLYLLRNTGAG
jgi:CDP-diacylglycerol--glycerol-3-phosphate 3-phosphatidyltransferase